ncbi:MAG: RuvX/YqgF family protein, partial [Planctomycetaceae bacterium]|nr:RuvX/YqgF family protein [Planctomycetaceae bacterium]
ANVSRLPVTWFDESYTSAHATLLLQQAGLTRKKRKQRLDKIAAQILLSTYLESSRQSDTTGSIEAD